MPGPCHTPANDSNCLAYTQLFLTMELNAMLVNETNRYATQYMADNQARLQQHAASRVGSWIDTDSVEMQAFLGLLITKNRMCDYWSHLYACDFMSWFSTVMSRNRFQLLLKFVHLVDNTRIPAHGQPGYDPTDKFKPLVEYANRKINAIVTPCTERSP